MTVMKVYHVVNPDHLQSILDNGIKRTSRGDKGDDQLIAQTDVFLDDRCPVALVRQGVSRSNNLYAYFSFEDKIVDITDGAVTSINEFISGTSQKIIELVVDPRRCYVSDLDTYDSLKRAIEGSSDSGKLDELAASYWRKLTPLESFSLGMIDRPEIMITYDIEPSSVRLVD